MEMKRIYGYPPIVNNDSRILILGTMPSVRSLEEGFYYAHPRNAFWPMMADIFDRRRPESTEEKIRLILENGLALWDVAASCLRSGSLDSAIRDVRLNDFAALFRSFPMIDRVLLNGGTAWSLYRRLPEEIVLARRYVKMPSTSPAYTLSYAEKSRIWRAEIADGGELE